ncbi:unnamed protein product [Hymenolepis diminuta]|uniref:Uncharacterized protein n=1 Tax=Hymenolepis diminuta TaxID=6216 RepID=A0A564YVZ1_HYMDI|nr:unnamed protein product [Hymenolepis diminuta]
MSQGTNCSSYAPVKFTLLGVTPSWARCMTEMPEMLTNLGMCCHNTSNEFADGDGGCNGGGLPFVLSLFLPPLFLRQSKYARELAYVMSKQHTRKSKEKN